MCESYELYESAFNLCGEFHIMGVTFHEILDISIFGAIMGTRRGGMSRRSPLPPLENKKIQTFLHMGAFQLLFCFHGGPFWGLPPPPTKIPASAYGCYALYLLHK